MTDSVNMSLDEIIKQSKQNRISRSRGRGGTLNRGRGGGRGGGMRGGGRGRGRGGGAGMREGRSRSRSRGPQGRGRSQSRGGSQMRGRSQSRGRSQIRAQSQSRDRSRSRSRQGFRSNSRARSVSRSRRGLTPRGRAGLEEYQPNVPPLVRNRINRGGQQNGLRRSNSNPNLRGSIHSRLGGNIRRGKPLAVAKRGIVKRGRGMTTYNRYSSIGLRSDQILQDQRMNFNNQNNVIKSQTFTRSRNNSFNSSQLTVSVANDFARRRRNSVGSAGYLTKQNLAQLNNQYGGYNTRRGPGSVKSMGSNRSNRSSRSQRSNTSNRSRGRGRGRGGNRGVGRKFVNKQILNPKLQKEIAAIQGKSGVASTSSDVANGINFSPTPSATRQTLNERFACV